MRRPTFYGLTLEFAITEMSVNSGLKSVAIMPNKTYTIEGSLVGTLFHTTAFKA